MLLLLRCCCRCSTSSSSASASLFHYRTAKSIVVIAHSLVQLTVMSVDGKDIREYRVHFDTELPQYNTTGGAIQGPNNTYDGGDVYP